MSRCVLALLLASSMLVASTSAQKNREELKGSPELIQPAIFTPSDAEILQKVQGQLLSAMALLESVQESPVKVAAEKRRNKFEFIRFGRR